MIELKNKKENHPWHAIAWTSLIGIEVAACIIIGYYGGSYLSEWTGIKHFTVFGVLTGLLIGVASIVYAIKRYLEDLK